MTSALPRLPKKPEALPLHIVQLTEQASGFFKALADPTRLAILYVIASQKDSRISSNVLSSTLGISAPTVTHHTKKLIAAKLVSREQCGKWGYYSIHEDNAETIAKIFADA